MRRLPLPVLAASLATAAAVLAGCGDQPEGGAGAASPSASATAAASPEDAFVADVRATGVDMPTHSTKSMGTTICKVLGMRLDAGQDPEMAFQQQVDSVYSTYGWTGTQAEAVVASAVRHLCPEHSEALPAG